MLKFRDFLLEELLAEGKYLFGVNHTDSNAAGDVEDLARAIGYKVISGGSHMRVLHPETDESITVISRGPGGLKRHRDALKAIADHQQSVGGFDSDTETIKSIRKALRNDPNASGLIEPRIAEEED